jgi:hypothetical protein
MADSDNDIVTWAVELQGDQIDRDAMVRMFSQGDFRVVNEESSFGPATFLHSKWFDGVNTVTEVMDIARPLVAKMNGAMRVFNRSEALVPGRLVSIHRNGGRGAAIVAGTGHFRLRGATLSATGVVIGADGKVKEDADRRSVVRTWIELAQRDEHVADVLAFLSAEPGWFELYKAFEEVQASCGGRQPLYSEGTRWTTKDDVNRFAMTAHHYRHANSPLPDNPMTIDEARNWLARVVHQWIEWLLDREKAKGA